MATTFIYDITFFQQIFVKGCSFFSPSYEISTKIMFKLKQSKSSSLCEPDAVYVVMMIFLLLLQCRRWTQTRCWDARRRSRAMWRPTLPRTVSTWCSGFERAEASQSTGKCGESNAIQYHLNELLRRMENARVTVGHRFTLTLC